MKVHINEEGFYTIVMTSEELSTYPTLAWRAFMECEDASTTLDALTDLLSGMKDAEDSDGD